MNLTRQERCLLEKYKAKRPRRLTEVPRSDWPYTPADLERLWSSREWLVQQWRDGGFTRLSVNRTSHNGQSWTDGITWEELQEIKAYIGYGDVWAGECYPPRDDTVNVANIRHLWILPEPPAFGWK